MGYTKQVIHGISWTGFLSLLTKSIGFLELIILARILSPDQFGAYAVALLVLGFMETVTETGINIILLQEESIEKMINSAWVVSILRGFFISAVIFVLAPLISIFFHSKDSLTLIYLISVVPLLRGLINPSIIRFHKELKFKKNFLFQSSILVVDTFVSITLTYILKNPVGILMGLISGVILELILSFGLFSPRPRLSFEKAYIGTILGRGKWITLNTISDYLFHNADNATVGRMLGAGSLGIYQMGYSIAVMPLEEIGKVMLYVSTPVLLKITDDKTRFKRAFLKTVLSSVLLGLPYLVVIMLGSQILISILGSKWEPLSKILPILGLVGLVRIVVTSSSALFISLKELKLLSIVSTASFISLIITLIPLVQRYGLFGAGISAFIASIVAVVLIFIFFKNLHKRSL